MELRDSKGEAATYLKCEVSKAGRYHVNLVEP